MRLTKESKRRKVFTLRKETVYKEKGKRSSREKSKSLNERSICGDTHTIRENTERLAKKV